MRRPQPGRIHDVVLLVGTVVVLGNAFVTVDEAWDPVFEAAWVVLALGYVGVRLRRLRRARRGDPDWPTRLSGPRTVTALSVLCAAQLLGSGLEVVGAPLDGIVDVEARALYIVVVVVAWVVVHLSYADRYARAHLGADRPGLVFPQEDDPGPVEFTYFALGVGTTFAASDVEVTTTRTRALVMWHGVLAFGVNVVVLGVIVGLLAAAH